MSWSRALMAGRKHMNMAYQQWMVVMVESPKIFLHQEIKIIQSYVEPSLLILKSVNWCLGLGFKVDMINQVNSDSHFAVDDFLERCCDVTVVCNVEELRSFVGLFGLSQQVLSSKVFSDSLFQLIVCHHKSAFCLSSFSQYGAFTGFCYKKLWINLDPIFSSPKMLLMFMM